MGGLLPIESYIRGVEYFVQKHSLKTVNIFLTTEDIKAADAFKDHSYVKSKQWKIYEYTSAISNMHSVHTPALDAKDSKGVHGLISMIVLLLSMESKYYIVTTASNWSGMIAALRSGVVDPDCGGCTDWIDLRFNPLLRPGVQSFNKQAHKDCPHYPYNSEGHLLYPADCHHFLPQLPSS